MRRLQCLLDSNLIEEDDILEFTFKKHRFRGRVCQGGFIYRSSWVNSSGDTLSIFEGQTFESLTDWTESCIQEKLKEYHTRYSSWKRVRHRMKQCTMEKLFKEYQRLPEVYATRPKPSLLLEAIAEQKAINFSLNEKLSKWQEWFESHHPNETPPVKTVKSPSPVPEHPKTVAVQPLVFSSDEGQYVILQRLKNAASPECVKWIKEMGQEKFKRRLDSIQTQKSIVWSPPSIENAGLKLKEFFT